MYPVLSRTDTTNYVAARLAATGELGPPEAEMRGAAGADWFDVVLPALDYLLDQWRASDLSQRKSDQSRDGLEGELSGALYERLIGLPGNVLSDRDFWRFCSAYLYDFVLWRQPTESLHALLPYFGARAKSLGRDCVPHRMFNRAHIARAGGGIPGESDLYALARFGASDLWKSHILRVLNGNAPVVVHEILVDVKRGVLKTEVVRPFARHLRRVRANVLFEVLDPLQARDFVDRETVRSAQLSGSLDEVGDGD